MAPSKAKPSTVQLTNLQQELAGARAALQTVQSYRAREYKDYSIKMGEQARVYEAKIEAFKHQLETQRKALDGIAEENVVLRAKGADYRREIDKLLREQVQLRDRLALASKPRSHHYDGPWPGDSGDVVDLERKLDALLGKDATKLLRRSLDAQRHWCS